MTAPTAPRQPFALTPRSKMGNRRRDPAPYLSERVSNDDLSAIRRPMCTTYVVLCLLYTSDAADE